MRRLVLYLVLCSSSGACSCAAYPAAGSLGDFLPFLSPGACPSAALVAWVGQKPFPSFFCASPAQAGWQGFAGFCTLCQGAPVGVVSALWVTVSSPCLLSLTLGWVSFWPAVSTASAAKLQSKLPFVVRPPFPVCLSFTCSGVGVVWSQVCGPTCSSCVLSFSGVSVAPFCRLSLWPHLLLLFSHLGFLSLGVC